MYNLRPYGERGWPTFETSAASIVLAHLTKRKRRGLALPPRVAQAEENGAKKLINIDVIGAPRVVKVAQSPGRLLRVCKKNLRSERIFFFGSSDRKEVVQLLLDFEDSIAVEVDRKRAKHLKLRTEDLVRARRSRYFKRFDGFAFDGSSVAPQRTSDGSPPQRTSDGSPSTRSRCPPNTCPCRRAPSTSSRWNSNGMAQGRSRRTVAKTYEQPTWSMD
jgi:hypothetical protein